jgi:hypothetical protein
MHRSFWAEVIIYSVIVPLEFFLGWRVVRSYRARKVPARALYWLNALSPRDFYTREDNPALSWFIMAMTVAVMLLLAVPTIAGW